MNGTAPTTAGTDAYYSSRFTDDPRRRAVWGHITKYLQRWVPAGAHVLDLAAGYADFANQVQANQVTAIDLSPELPLRVAAHVHAVVGDATDLSQFPSERFDLVFASNFLEHLDFGGVEQVLDEVRRVLRPAGTVILVQPNFRLAPGKYFDDYTHRTVFTDRSLVDRVVASGFAVIHAEARFIPLTMKSRLAFGHKLVPLYLRIPAKLRPLAGQMLVVAQRSGTAEVQ